MANLLCYTVCVVFILTLVSGAKLPPSFKTCKLSDPDLNECLRVNAESAVRDLKKGVSSLGILPAEPLQIQAVEIGKSNGNSPVQLDTKYTDLKLFGIADSDFKSFHAAFGNPVVFKVGAFTPSMNLIGNYEANGKILVLPLTGKGIANITLVGTVSEHEITIEKFEKKGKTYARIIDYKVTLPKTERAHFHLDNLFNGDKALGDQMNSFLNENWEIVFSELKTGYEQTFGQIFQQIASSIKTCKLSDPNLNECLRVNGEHAFSAFKEGFPSLGILPADPLRIEQVSIGKKTDSPIQLEIRHNDLNLYGATTTKITKFESSFDNNPVVLNIEMFAPLLRLIGNYEADGRLLVLPLTGNGISNITLVDTIMKGTITIEKFEKKGKTYGRADLKLLFEDTKRVYYHLSNLFNGDKVLGDQMNNFMNENWDIVFKELKSGYEETFGLSFTQIANQIFTKVPFDDIFLPD